MLRITLPFCRAVREVFGTGIELTSGSSLIDKFLLRHVSGEMKAS